MIEAVTVAHVVIAAAWFGHKLLLPRDLRVAVRNPGNWPTLLDRMRRVFAFSVVTGLLTLGSGLWLVYLTISFPAPTAYYITLGITVLILIVTMFATRPAWGRVKDSIGSGDTPGAVGGVSTVNRFLALEALLWVLAVVMILV